MERQANKHIMRIVIVGLMAALTYALSLISIPIPTILGISRLHFGNSMCLLAGLLFGGMNGGLSAGIGSFFYDLFAPNYIASAPFTFISKFSMGFVAGKLNRSSLAKKNVLITVLSAVSGQIAYIILYLSYTFVKDLLLGNAAETALTDVVAKLGTSSVNAVIAVIISVPLYYALVPALRKLKVYSALGMGEEKPADKKYFNPVTIGLTVFAFIVTALYATNLAAQPKIQAAQDKKEQANIERIDELENKIDILAKQAGIEFLEETAEATE